MYRYRINVKIHFFDINSIWHLSENYVTPSTAVYASPLVPIIKPDSSVRLAIDYAITVNPYITSPSSPIPNTKELIFDLSAYKYFCELDLTKAFRQLVLNESSSNLLSYVTPIGQFRPLTLPEGVKSAPHIFQQAMYNIFRITERIYDGTFIYFDNLFIGANSPEELLIRIENILDVCDRYNIKLKLDKYLLFKSSKNNQVIHF